MSATIHIPGETLTYDDEYAALEDLHRRGWTDGLPVVVPTPERVEAMLAWSQGLDPDIVLGVMGPAERQATVSSIAVNAVMAGCRPDYFPTVLAMVEAALEPVMNLGPMQETTHSVTPFVLVNGPVRADIEVASGAGVLGPGHRANASIGRALRLIMMNVGGGYVGVGDMATLGTAAKFTMCVGEAEEQSPFTAYHVSRGFDAADSTVTVVPVEGPRMVTCQTNGDDLDGSAERLVKGLGTSLANVNSTSIYLGQGAVVVLLNPHHAAALHNVGMTRETALERIWEAASDTQENLRRFNPGIVRSTADGINHAVTSPDRIVLAVAGAAGDYSVAMTTWAAPTDLCLPVTKKLRDAPFC